ncbi:MAG: hypothetical protein PHX72_03030, partial [Candidatus Shapirobacteria bacterium]|nr:hypothetical protein [Candidatus Shapirobacteria bacterium]
MVNLDSLINRPPQPQGSVFGQPEKEQQSPVSSFSQVAGENVSPPDGGDSSEKSAKERSFGWWKFLLVILVLVLAVGGYYFWQKEGVFKGSIPETVITYWGLWEPESVMVGLIEEFEKENPKIKINYTQQN